MASRWIVLACILAVALAGCTEDRKDDTDAGAEGLDGTDDGQTGTSTTTTSASTTTSSAPSPSPSPSPTPAPTTSPPVAPPPPAPTAPPTIVIQGDGHVKSFSIDWTANPSRITWWFGDGSHSTERAPSHAYTTDGTYTVTVEAQHSGVSWEAKETITIEGVPLVLRAQPSGDTVAFSYTWGKTASIIRWDFGDGTTSSDAAPTHTYTGGGPFTVTLTVDSGGASATEQHTVLLTNFPVTITATRDVTDVAFSATWGWPIDSYAWDFGDGTTTDESAPTHRFPEGGTFSVRLTVTGKDGDDVERQATGTQVVTVPRYALTLNVVQDLEDVDFSFTWELEATTIAWDLGDGTTSPDATVSHSYPDIGSYTVTLTVDDGQVFRTATTVVHVTNMHLDVTVVPGLPVNVFQATYTWVPATTGVVTQWDFGDGTTSSNVAGSHVYSAEGTYQVRLTVSKGTVQATWLSEPITVDIAPEPHVIVGIPDTGINPYHEMYYRAERTFPPDAYIEGFPELQPLPLSVGPGKGSYAERLAADAAVWASVEKGKWYWIPQTMFVAVHCEEPYVEPDDPATAIDETTLDQCILDDSHMHGTGTTSSALMENPDALIAFSESRGNVDQFVEAGIPVDVYSVSWGSAIPVAGVGGAYPFPAPICSSPRPAGSLYVKSSGNEPALSTTLDCSAGHPDIITVGGAYAADESQAPLAYREPDVVSYFCRPTAQTATVSGLRDSYCGTSFSAPTVAGALSKVILELRREAGYAGNMVSDATAEAYIDDTKTVSLQDLRDALEETASYTPTAEYPNSGGIPLAPVAPWIQWAWGFYDGTVAEDTITWLQGDRAPIKSNEARLYLEAIQAYKWAYFGGDPEPAMAYLEARIDDLAETAFDILDSLPP